MKGWGLDRLRRLVLGLFPGSMLVRLPALFPDGRHWPLFLEPFRHQASRLVVILVDIVVES